MCDVPDGAGCPACGMPITDEQEISCYIQGTTTQRIYLCCCGATISVLFSITASTLT